jgi:protein O-GlcNAc transferase
MKVFSFCLYNPYKPLYYDGLLENMTLIRRHYPDWGIYVYIGNDVPIEFTQRLEYAGAILRYTNVIGPMNMIHRFLAIEEPDIELMVVRDADSRVHWKDRWAIDEFVKSSFLAHSVRDCPVHSIPMLGGTWALKRDANVPIGCCFDHYKNSRSTFGDVDDTIGKDQTFLNYYIWPRVRHSLLVHTSITFQVEGDTIVPFPFEWTNAIYIGRIESPGYIEPPMPRLPRKTLVDSLPRGVVKLS